MRGHGRPDGIADARLAIREVLIPSLLLIAGIAIRADNGRLHFRFLARVVILDDVVIVDHEEEGNQRGRKGDQGADPHGFRGFVRNLLSE
jgi:hypothetical protein